MHRYWMTSCVPFRPTFLILRTHIFKQKTNITALHQTKQREISHPIQKEMCLTEEHYKGIKRFSLWVSKLDLSFSGQAQNNCLVQTYVKISGTLSEQARSTQGPCFCSTGLVAKQTCAHEFCSMQQLA